MCSPSSLCRLFKTSSSFVGFIFLLSVFLLAGIQGQLFATTNKPSGPGPDKQYLPLYQAQSCGQLNAEIDSIDQPTQLLQAVRDRLTSTIKQAPKDLESSQQRLIQSFLHRHAHCYFSATPIEEINKRISWQELRQWLEDRPSSFKNQLSFQLIQLWISYLRSKSTQLDRSVSMPFPRSEPAHHSEQSYLKMNGALVTSGQASMWMHCKKRFEYLAPQWRAELISGYVSRTFQFIRFSREASSLQQAASRYPPPGYGTYQDPVPGVRIRLHATESGVPSAPWDLFYQSCSGFGFEAAYPDHPSLSGELRFAGIDALYQEIFANTLIPANIRRDLPPALQAADFYPSPEGLRVILALSAQESTIQWNPKLNIQKKKLLRRRFKNALERIDNTVPSSVTHFFLSSKHEQQLDQLMKTLQALTDPDRDSSREYDFYLWSRRAYAFIEELTDTYKKAATVGQWFFDLQSLKTRLEKEPQTFGLWQINVNHLMEKIRCFKQLRRAFPEIYQNRGGEWIINRSWLVDALSGKSQSRLSRRKTLELIIHTHLKPHYLNHLLGDTDDLMYFIAENMAGEMSTFRAAIQHQLNAKMHSVLSTDGDLTYYQPYSTDIDWEKPSKTYRKLMQFVEQHAYYFSTPLDPEKLVRDLCNADTWEELKSLELFQKLMGSEAPVRRFPDIRSKLYNQTPLSYARQVERKSHLF